MARLGFLMLVIFGILSNAFAGSLKFSGGISGALFKETHLRGRDSEVELTDAYLELSGGKELFGFNFSVGSILTPTVLNSVKAENRGNFGLDRENDKFGLLWGYLSLLPLSEYQIELGVLPTMVGFELPLSFLNPNITYGLVWNSQPFIYRGVRLIREVDGELRLFGEYDRGSDLNGKSGDSAFSIGLSGNYGKLSYALSYFDYSDFKNLVDFTLGCKIGRVKVFLIGDYQWLDDDKSKSAYGVALYVIPDFGSFSVPLRIEYVNDERGSNIYGFSGGAYSLTLTPTFRILSNLTFRLEYSFVKANRFRGFNGSDHKNTVSAQVFVRF